MAFPVEIMSVGTWNGFTFTLDHLKDMVNNFGKLKSTIKPPVKLGHSKDETGKPALGWVSDLKLNGDKLMAYLTDVPDMLMQAIKKKMYRRVSSEVLFEYTYDGKKYNRVLSGLALLGAEAPAVKNLEDLQAYLTQNSQGKFEQLAVFTYTQETKGEPEMDLKAMEAALEKMQSSVDKLTDGNKALLKENETLKASLKAKDEEAIKFAQEASKADLKTFCDGLVKEGKMLPAQRDKVCGDDAMEFTEDGTAIINFSVFKSFAELGTKQIDPDNKFKDKTKDKPETFKDAAGEVDKRAKKFISDNPNTSYTDAVFAVLDEDEKLADAYSDNSYQASGSEEGE